MSNLLESCMLLCFGISWPISLMKNIKAHSAKNMSLQFILLIFAGYVAGISAKLISHTINYVLAIYLLNVVVVSLNIFVYFKNKKEDEKMEKRNQEEAHCAAEEETRFDRECRSMARLNGQAKKGGVVFFGSDTFFRMHFKELAEEYGLDECIYNRSISGLTLADAISIAPNVIAGLAPTKLFVNLGELDLRMPEENFVEQYRWLLYILHQNCDAKLYLVPIQSEEAAAIRLNERLRELADEVGCTFVDTKTCGDEQSMFAHMRSFVRTHPISFAEAMSL